MTDQKNRRPTGLLAALVVLGGLGILLVLGTPLLLIAIQAAREAAERERAVNNLAQVRQALENYHSQHATLPLHEKSEIAQPNSAGDGPRVSLEVPASGQASGEIVVDALKK